MPVIDQLANVGNTKKGQSTGSKLNNEALTNVMKQRACSFSRVNEKNKTSQAPSYHFSESFMRS